MINKLNLINPMITTLKVTKCIYEVMKLPSYNNEKQTKNLNNSYINFMINRQKFSIFHGKKFSSHL